ncbi:autotransporter outer membrane beta-barrel domain-containing protein [Ruegeria sp. Alg231-54]|uniref:autotransporter outer membrane beta-barrel domain-containing protein n=1 Tax=Ruegeria sp. Alg231-54 TaxID=1922221 RepID=UPI000D55487D|nr:autotransporter outer membrane beta-barrel domain-containing protein [Ruegeria sp. Alg231-54]
MDTTVSALIVDPASTPTAGTTAFVETADGYVFLVKDVGATIYNSDNPPLAFEIVSISGATAQISNSGATGTAGLSTQLTLSQYNSNFNSSGTPGAVTPPEDVSGPNGVNQVVYGQDGSNGRDGALVVPPSSGGNGSTGPTQTKTLSSDVNATSNMGWQVGSVGGDGGNGGDSYLSFWDGRDGGDGGKGGTVNATQSSSSTIQTSGNDNDGIFAFSRSGKAGNGGSGFAAPGGGTGGHSADGGNVTVTQRGVISTSGDSADGIYALSVSNNGGNGGSQWGLVGASGDGGFGGSGGAVTVNTTSTGSILTTGDYANGIYAQSIGGSGGSAGTSGNLLVSLIGGADNGGNGGTVTVSHAGAIETQGDFSRGIVAQSIGGGGGSGGAGGGLVALSLGGVGSNGGSGSAVSVTVQGSGSILTSGKGADGVMAQSIGGSGGTGANSYGLVAIGGTGSRGGTGDAVSVSNYGQIQTGGDGARGIIAQSIGGGGGDGGSSAGMVSVGGNGSGGGAGSTVTIVNDGIITTTGDDAMGILAQSIGGGGGNGGSSGSVGAFVGVAIGGDGGSGGEGGDVDVTLSNTDSSQPSAIQTSGDRSTGVFAQSVGGGGGNGGGAVSVAVGAFGAASVSVGGSAGDGGDGGDVSISGSGSASVQTGGDDAIGVMLQSVGGGGGNGGYAVSVAVSGGPVSGSLAVGVGGDGGTGGEGGTVTVGQFNSSGVAMAAGFEGTIVTTGNRSTGMLFQSVGGGGGNGGLAVAATGGASALFSGNVSIGIGGQAGSAGNGGDVQVYTKADITTTGTNSSALIAQSVGGGGGNGGGSIAAGISASAGAAVGINVGVGGDGGGAGIGGDVTLIAGGTTIETSGAFSSGVVAQSVGGGGGNGGYSVGASADIGGAAAGSVSVGLGGKAGGGGDGGAVTAQVDADVTTRGDDSGGVVVQSIGGGGGNGGFSVAAGLAAGGAGAGTVDVGLGGDGGSGGIGGSVTGVRVNGDVSTEGLRSTGVVIQSIGGGGGNGGFNVTAGVAAGGAGAGSIGVGLGGGGATGGNGGVVEGQVAGNVTTLADNSSGVVFQSIGGGGGNGGFNVTAGIAGAGAGGGAVTVGLGGDASGGGIGQTVTAQVSGTVSTGGADATAVLAQSVGGGGGNGGFNVSASLAGAGVGSGAVSVGLGGSGGTGATGGTVNLTTTDAIVTAGDRSSGVVAQSIGGGGGNGGFNVSGTGAGAGVGSGAVSVGLGGDGDGGGDGGAVTLTSGGTILTQGNSATAFLAQSIGGGGGNGGFNVSASVQGSGVGGGGVSVGLGGDGAGGGDGNTVIATSNNAVETRGNQSSGVVAQSIGGGGGNGGFNVSPVLSGAGTGSGAVSVGLGGSGDTGGDGGNVTLTSNGTILTDGFASSGFVAQSLGGGGGNGGFNVSPTLSGAGVGAGSVSVGLGGSGGDGGDGSLVTASTTANVVTKGDASVGILAQSVGGGGGNGGFNISPALAGAGTGSGAISVGLGGSGGGGGTGGVVGLTVANNVQTEGAQSSAVVAQSIGGGGGNGGFNVSASVGGAGTGSGAAAVGLGGRGTGGGDASAVTANVTGNLVTLGETSTGLLAQSVGGGGGNGGMNISVAVAAAGTGSGGASVGLGGASGTGGDGGTAEATLNGNVSTQGDESGGFIVQSLGGGGGNGGLNVSAAVNISGTGGGAIGVGIGGSGGDGGSASTAAGSVTGDVTTSGDNATGVLVQSVGGGGGNGGVNISGALSIARTGSGAAGIGVGGFGGSGGTSGAVDNTFSGNVSTSGSRSAGIIAQSLGGGGGNGATNISGAISVASNYSGGLGIGVGGFGGDGGDANNVTQQVTGNVVTTGDDSVGILTQSLGGGGGNGGTNISAALSLSRSANAAVGIGVGGFGGGGANAGALVQSTVTGGVGTVGDRSTGILTQSLGGGGGNGGTNISASLGISQENGGSVSLGVGGFGGGAGNAGEVISTLRSRTDGTATTSVVTTGADSIGVMAQSVGGGGGNGGLNVSGAVNLTGKSGAAVALGLGGFGGGGGDAGAVTLDVESNVVTAGDGSHGVLAQSLGGGGGTGGVNISGSLALTKPSGSDTIFSVAAGVGGFGGSGGDASNVDLDYTGNVQAVPMVRQPDGTFAVDQSKGGSGIIAQSLGGGGGNGGTNVSGGIAISGKPGAGQTDSSKSYAVVVGVGGFGGGGGDAGNVDVNIGAGSTIRAHGTGQSGLLAQSLGGGGGNGGLNVSGGIVSDSSLIVGVGGFAGDGGKAGDVTVMSQADITVTTNPDDISIPDTTTFEDKLRDFLGDTIVDDTEELASSFGLERLFIDMGVFNEEKPDTDGSAGLMAQSIGGGGGNGGLNVSGGIALSKDGKIPSVTFGVGGFGGDGNVSGDVTVDHTGTVSVAGNWKHGVLAQSIAGGGGNGALNVTGQLNYGDSNNSDGKTDLSIVGGLGGHGGTGADAGDVSVAQSGNISTNGYHARGVFAQSIGGGGGTGGINATFVGTKDSSPIAMGIGGFGGGGGDAGDVTVARGSAVAAAGTITTDGAGSHGIEASSIGGGGGDAGINAVVGISKTTGSKSNGGTGDSSDRKTPTNTGVDDSVIANYNAVLDELEGKVNPADSSGNKTGVSAVIAIGGDAGTAGDGGTVDIDHYGDIVTLQDGSHGVFGQSIGGGGGNAALNLGMTYELASDATNKGFGLAIGGGTGEGGIGGSVDVRNTGDITTSGADSHGLFAQSVGGGGGNAGYNSASTSVDGGNVNIQIGRTGGTGGSGGDVYASSNGIVRTAGNRSYGFFAQSIGNGGGNSSSTSVSIGTPKTGDSKGNKASLSVGLEGGTGGEAGDVTAVVAGTIVTEGTDAHAVFAQSVGGGGGNGGKASNSAGKGTSVALSIGGTGGTGGVGGKVDVSNTARIATLGDRSGGLMAQSIGGAGGTGGMVQAGQSNLDTIKAVVNPSTVGTTISVNIGGTGGDGMTSDTVTVVSDGIITTEGTMAHGIFAQSVGGGGGMGGLVENRIISLRKDIGNTATLSIGGNGGTGAMSAAVSVTNRDLIQTTGAKSIGIYAQSVGGGGGDAQQVRNIILGRSSDGATTNAILIGGTGGTGGSGSTVTVVNEADATIRTTGKESHGILAQSIGGGGGNGGSTISVDGRYGGAEASTRRALQFGLGGSGGTGGTGGNVLVTNAGTIVTTGEGAHGIFAQSIGGGGGNGGSSITGTLRLKTGDSSSPTAQLNIGGSGGSGNIAGNVVVTSSGDIRVDGAGAYGIMAQSVGGGGGNGGLAVAMDVNDLKNTMTGKSYSKIAIGGSGGDGADGGDVTVNHTGAIVVNAENGFGIFAQSVGGGGGNAGYSVSSPLVSALDYTVSQLLGAREGATGSVGTVTVNSTGDILVNGSGSEAIFAQSVNGGGGNSETSVDFTTETASAGGTGTSYISDISLGGDEVSDMAGSQVAQSHTGNIATTSDRSTGLMLQSIGGGGGTSTNNINIQDGDGIDITARLGAINTDDASGGDVNGSRTGDVGTDGAFSTAGAAQSIGGGGGKLVLNSTGAADPNKAASVILGSDPSFRNDGGDIDLSLDGVVTTTGDRSFGQSVQSIGAGGGEVVVAGLGRLDVTLGAQDDSTGDGGTVDLTNIGGITTSGSGSHGFVIQSIGGGGGLVSTDLDASQITVNLSPANGGDGGDITFTQNGNIVTTGENAIGVVAQSLGGGGGMVDSVFRGSAGGVGSGGTIDMALNGNILSVGEGGIGVLAQSEGRDGAGAITLGFDGVVMGGTGQADAVASIVVDGGANNVLTLSKDTVLLSGNNQLVNGGDGNDQISLAGDALGNLDLGAGTNGLTVEEGGAFYALDTINLGAAGLMQVNGDFILGANWGLNTDMTPTVKSGDFVFTGNVSQTTNLTGSLAFGATASSTFDAYFLTTGASGGNSDLVNVNGDATMGGTLTPQLNTLQRALPLVIVNPNGTAADAGTTIQDTVVLDYSIGLNGSTSDGSSIDLVITPDYSTANMNANEAAVGDYINQVLNGQGSAAQGELFALIGNMTSEADVIAAIGAFTVADYAADAVDAYYGTRVFADALHNCERFTDYQAGDDPRNCVWFSGGRSFYDREQTGIYDELDINNTNLSAGVRLPVGDELYAGFALGHDQISLRNGSQYNATGDRFNLGASLTKYTGPWEFAAMLSAGWSDYDSDRSGGISGVLPNGNVVNTVGVSSIKHKMNQQNLRLSFAYDHRFAGGSSYLRPEIAVDATRLATESNGDATLSGIVLQDDSEMIYSLTPSLEIGTEQILSASQKLRVSFRAGAIISSNDTVSVSAGFAGASAADGGFTNTSFIGDAHGLVSARLGLFALDDSSFINLSLDHMFGDSTKALQVGLGLGLQF